METTGVEWTIPSSIGNYRPEKYEPHPGSKIRKAVMQYEKTLVTEDTGEREFAARSHFERRHDQTTKDLHRSLVREDDETAVGHRRTLFVYSVGLLACGRLEVIDDVVDNLPQEWGYMQELSWSIPLLLPIPQWALVYEFIEYPAQVKEWVHRNRDKLIWNEVRGRYDWIVAQTSPPRR